MAKCLVTGANGFIGAHLVRRLVERGDEVVCLVRRSSNLRALDGLPIRLAYGDVTRPDSLPAALEGCQVVYHLAGLTKALSYDALLRVNAGGVENLMQAAAELPTPPVVVFVSSLAAAGPAVNGEPRRPEDVPQPVSRYGKSKLAGELAAATYADRVPLTILRPPIVIGEGDLLSLDLFHSVSAFRVHLVPGRQVNRFSVIHAADLAEALVLAAEQGARVRCDGYCQRNGQIIVDGQGIYYPADEEMPTFSEIGQLIARGLGRRHVLCVHTPHAGAWALAGISELVGKITRKPMSLNLDKVREATAGSWTCCPRSARDQLRFQPAAPLAERFRQTAEWYRAEGWI